MVRRWLLGFSSVLLVHCSDLKPGGDSPGEDGGASGPTTGSGGGGAAGMGGGGAGMGGRGGWDRGSSSNDSGSPGDAPVEDRPMGRGYAFGIATGLDHTCAVLDVGVQCWGAGDHGQLGYGNLDDIGDDETPTSAGYVELGAHASDVVLGDHHSCAILDEGSVRCWGSGSFGQLGYGNTKDVGAYERPSDVGEVDVGGPVYQLALGRAHTCALLAARTVRCWGYGGDGALGYGNTKNIGDDERPASAGDVDVGGTVAMISAGGNTTCALLDSGTVRCWGDDSMGQLGYGRMNDRIGDDETPASAGDIDIGGIAIGVKTAGLHTCVVLDPDRVRCWGYGPHGELGYPGMTVVGVSQSPASVGDVDVGGRAVDLVAAGNETCALLLGGKVRCWGSGASGSLGYANTDDVGDDERPAIAGDVNVGPGLVYGFSTSGFHTCVRMDGGQVRCWGYGKRGVLGYGRDVGNIGDDEAPSTVGDVPTR